MTVYKTYLFLMNLHVMLRIQIFHIVLSNYIIIVLSKLISAYSPAIPMILETFTRLPTLKQ